MLVRPASYFFLGTLLCISGIGCAAMDAVVSHRKATQSASPSAERLTAIARVFERQGHLDKADATYRMALRKDSTNKFARDRISYIAGLGKSKRIDGSDDRETAIAGVIQNQPDRPENSVTTPSAPHPETPVDDITPADSLLTEKSSTAETRTSKSPAVESSVADLMETIPAAAESKSTETLAESGTTAEPAAKTNSSAFAALEEIVNRKAAEEAGRNTGSDESIAAATQTEPVESESAEESEESREELVLTADSSSDSAANADSTQQFALLEQSTEIAESLILDGDDAGFRLQEPAPWKSVSFDEIADWMDTPDQFRRELLHAVSYGEDDGVKALAATVLGEMDDNDTEVTHILQTACVNAGPLLRVSAIDALARRGEIDGENIHELLKLASNSDNDVRTQAIASLRQGVGTEWAQECVSGLAGQLNDSNPAVQILVAVTLGDFGTDAVSAKDDLLSLQKTTQDPELLTAIKLTLMRMNVNNEESVTNDLNADKY